MSIEVVPNLEGGWNVQNRVGKDRCFTLGHYPIQLEAVTAAKVIAKRQKAELVVRNSSSRIRAREHFGREPKDSE